MSTVTRTLGILFLATTLSVGTGCTGLISPEEIAALLARAEDAVNSVIDNIQEQNPFVVPGDVDLPDGVVVDPDPEVLVIDDFNEDVNYDALYNSTFLAFTNLTGFDIVVDYVVTVGTTVIQDSVFVYDGESVILGYDCADIVAVIAEYDFEFDGTFVQDFQFTSLISIRYVNFDCGQLIEYEFTPDEVTVLPQYVDLTY